MRVAPLACLLVLAACASDPPEAPALAEGRWVGTLTPMNHSDRPMPVAFDIGTASGAPSVTLIGPGGATIDGRETSWDGTTLRFVFDEPEAGIPLTCEWPRQADGSLAGRCTDPEGKWARFEVSPAVAG